MSVPDAGRAASIGPDPVALPIDDGALRRAARDLEAAFLAEMLKSAGFGEARDAFGGGMGEDQFASFLRVEHARAMAETGGIGLAEAIFNAMKESRDAQH